MLTNDKNEKSPAGSQLASKKHNRNHKARKNVAGSANNNVNKTGNTTAAVLAPNASRRTAGANWNASILSKTRNGDENSSNASANNNKEKKPRNKPTKYVAIDCEMVGVGFQGRDDMLARVSIVDAACKVLLDKFVKPVEIITDYRTAVSGIRPLDLQDGEEFLTVQKEVLSILKDCILVGHNVKKDLEVLHIKHPYCYLRDTSSYKPLASLVSAGKTPSLKRLSAKILGNEIQTGEHNSVEDAKAAMNVYKFVAKEWEASLAQKHYRKH